MTELSAVIKIDGDTGAVLEILPIVNNDEDRARIEEIITGKLKAANEN